MRGKKIFLIVAVIAFALAAAGCIPKKSTPQDQSGSPTPTPSNTAIPPGGQIPATPTTPVAADLTQITQTYSKNYAKAVEEAAKGFSNRAQFCTVMIEFPPPVITNATQSFYFISTDAANTSMQSYYFVVQFNLVPDTMERVFMVKKDQTDISCAKLVNDQIKVNYAQAYQTAGQKGYFSSFKITDVYRIQILLQDAGWQITVVDKSGQPALPLNPISATELEVVGSPTPSAGEATKSPAATESVQPNV